MEGGGTPSAPPRRSGNIRDPPPSASSFYPRTRLPRTASRIGRGSGIASAAGFAWPSRLGFLVPAAPKNRDPGRGADFPCGHGKHLPSSDGGKVRGSTARSAMGSAAPGSFEGLAQGDQDASTSLARYAPNAGQNNIGLWAYVARTPSRTSLWEE